MKNNSHSLARLLLSKPNLPLVFSIDDMYTTKEGELGHYEFEYVTHIHCDNDPLIELLIRDRHRVTVKNAD